MKSFAEIALERSNSPNTEKFVDINYKHNIREPKTFREDLISKFIIEVHKGNKGTKYEAKTEEEWKKFKRNISMKINSNPFLKESWQLESFYKQCASSGNFGKCFNGSLKTKKS